MYGDVFPEAREALRPRAKWYADGVLDPEYITGENTGGYWALNAESNVVMNPDGPMVEAEGQQLLAEGYHQIISGQRLPIGISLTAVR